MKSEFLRNRKIVGYLLPTLLVCVFYLNKSRSHSLHDFGNSYFSAKLVHDGIAPEEVLFDIYAFNNYVWEQGYPNEILDFYVNSPFTLAAFYPLAFIPDAQTAKLIFNLISILCFLIGLYMLARDHLKELWLLLLVPVLFLIPIRNQVLFGQSYFIIFFCVVLAFTYFRKGRHVIGSGMISIAVLLKFFPFFYGAPLLQLPYRKIILYGLLFGIVLSGIAIYITGYSFWEVYFFDVLPHTFSSKTANGFQTNSQSIEVFLKTILIRDSYYNPTAFFNSEQIFTLVNWLVKASIIGIVIDLTIRKRDSLFTSLSLWVVALFLLQSRTATYAQILWLIPLVVIFKQNLSDRFNIVFLALIFCISNVPYHWLTGLPKVLHFGRLLLVLVFSILFFRSLGGRFNWKFFVLGLLLFLPLHITGILKKTVDTSVYVLDTRTHFMIYDFQKTAGNLSYSVIGKNGSETLSTQIPLEYFDEELVEIKDNQVYFKGQQVTANTSLKKKPVLVNDCEIYYLSDYRSRRGAFTIKKVNVCNTVNNPS